MAVVWKKLAFETDVVLKSLFDAYSILAADTDNTPAKLTVGASTIVGRAAAGGIVALTATETRTILNVADGATANAKATGAELDTGTDDAKFATAKALKDSHNVPSVAPSTDGKVMTSDGTDWVSEAPAAPAAHTLNSHTAADGAVDFNLQQATDLVVFTVATEAAMALLAYTACAVGQLCFCTGELTLHVCTASSV